MLFRSRVPLGGELLRRYWLPIAAAQELTEDSPTKFVRVLGEDLVLFKDKSGNLGLIQDHCPHRGASLLYGRVEERGIACAYHGWLYDTQGNCLETPAEPADSKFYLTVKATAYPVQQFLGLRSSGSATTRHCMTQPRTNCSMPDKLLERFSAHTRIVSAAKSE